MGLIQTFFQMIKDTLNRISYVKNVIFWATTFLNEELNRGSLISGAKGLIDFKFEEDMSLIDLFEEKVQQIPDKPFLIFQDQIFSYKIIDQHANRLANYLLQIGGEHGKRIGLFMHMSQQILDMFWAIQKVGMTAVPINISVSPNHLLIILEHFQLDYLCIDASLYKKIQGFPTIANMPFFIVNNFEGEFIQQPLPNQLHQLGDAYREDKTYRNPGIGYRKQNISLVISKIDDNQTIQTVLYPYGSMVIKRCGFLAGLILNENDIVYTTHTLWDHYLCHLLILVLSARCSLVIAQKVQTAQFWNDIRKHKASVVCTSSVFVSDLMKQPRHPKDKNHTLRWIMASSCPLSVWESFESRFGIPIYDIFWPNEHLSHVFVNLGSIPKGALELPYYNYSSSFKIENNKGESVDHDMWGELLINNENYLNSDHNHLIKKEKPDSKWIRTGCFAKIDANGYLFIK